LELVEALKLGLILYTSSSWERRFWKSIINIWQSHRREFARKW